MNVLVRMRGIVAVSLAAMLVASCGGGLEDEIGGNCEDIGERFAQRLEAIPQNQGACRIYSGQLDAYLDFRPNLIASDCFGPGELDGWDQNIQQLRQGVASACEGGTPPGRPDRPGPTQKYGGVAFDLMDGCSHAHGLTTGYADPVAAKDQAIDDCVFRGGSRSECSAYSANYNECAAIVYGTDHSGSCWMGWAPGLTSDEAHDAAVSECQDDLGPGRNCRRVDFWCMD